MALCIDCGKALNFLTAGTQGRCNKCTTAYVVKLQRVSAEEKAEIEAVRTEIAAKDTERETAIDQVVLTTETASNLKIVRRIEIVTAECAFGMNIFKDIAASFRDFVGGRSEVVQNTMRDARRTALRELKREAYLVGANAVVGVDLDYTEIGGANQGMVMLIASGTAVVIED